MNYKTFKVRNHNIFYNAYDNTFYKVDKEFIKAIDDFIKKNYNIINDNLFKYLHDNIKKVKCNYSINNIREDNEIFIIFNITANCNLACKYCILKKKTMMLSVNKVKSLYKNVTNNPYLKKINNIGIGFYGGEPLLEFAKIKLIVKMSELFYKNKKINFKITTNGTLMTKEIMNFFVANNFFVSVSLDGDRAITDKHRGEGVFNHVYNNLLYLKTNHKNYWQENLQISCVFASIYEYLEQKKFFINHFPKITIFFSPILQNEYNLQIELFKDIYNKLVVYRGKLTNFIYFLEIRKIARKIIKILSIKEKSPLNSSRADCNPFSSTMFVKENGDIYFCMNSQLPSFQIGSCNMLDFESIKSSITEYFDFKNTLCSVCWAVRFCKNCYSRNFDKYSFNKNLFKKNCKNMKEILLLEFKIYNFLYYYKYNELKEILHYAKN